MKRGEVWWASLPAPDGSGPGYRRPVLIIQANSFNESRIATVVVAAITSNLNVAAAPGNVRLGQSDTGLAKTSVVNVSQLLAVERTRLTSRLRALSAASMLKVNDGLRLLLDL